MILFLSNNYDVAGSLIHWLKNIQSESVIELNDKISPDFIQSISPEFVISYNYKHIVSKSIIDIMSNRIINLHISYLPWNRGADPNVWSFLEDSIKGVTIHLMDESVDTGKILVQEMVHFNEDEETLSSTYFKLHETIQKLFKSNWVKIKNSEIKGIPQSGQGSFHRIIDFQNLKGLLLGNDGWNITISELKKRYRHHQL